MTKDEALKLALEALGWTDEWRPQGLREEAITAIKEALAQQDSKDKEQAKTDSFVRQLDKALTQPEPWEKFCDSNCVWTDHHPDCKLAEQEPVFWYRPIGEDGLYEGPIHNASIERVRKLSGAWVPLYPHSQRKEQEPVACITYKEVADTMNSLWGGTLVQIQIAEEMKNKKLYITPPQRKPLTDEEIILIVADCASSHQHTDIHFARAIEAKLKEKNT